MDPDRFDRLVSVFSTAAPRRRLLRLGAALPVAGSLAALLDAAGEARPRRRRGKRKRGQGTVVVCHSGETLSVPRHAVRAVLRGGGARGACAEPGGGPGSGNPCIPATADLQEIFDRVGSGATLNLCAGAWRLPKTLTIRKDLTLIGADASATVLDGAGANRVLAVDAGAAVTVRFLTVTNGNTSTNGGGIHNQGVLSLIDVTVSRNSAGDRGGGIFNGGALTLDRDTRVTSNVAGDGGGIYHEGTEMTVSGGASVFGNTATRSGGGIVNNGGRVTLRDGFFVAGNRAAQGGGIYNNGGTLGIDSTGNVLGNTALEAGGGIATVAGTVTLGAGDVVINNVLADGTASNCAPANTIANCIG